MKNMKYVNPVSPFEKSLLKDRSRGEYREIYDRVSFPTSAELEALEEERRVVIEKLVQHGAAFGFNNTKVDCRGLSPGCRICGEGNWSCLFINNRCNADCFYCPAPQDQHAEPSTNNLTFSHPGDYLDYLEKFNFKGCSISGGEPFLVFDKTIRYIRAIKNRFGSDMYVWLYTNGLLADEPRLAALRDAGLDEIRFDIAALGYNAEKPALAARFIPNVTVEIPAVPHHFDRLLKALPLLGKAGVKFLNLHQMRCTAHNAEKLLKRGYTFIHAGKLLVAESEITALKVMLKAFEENLPIQINYCSFVFKHTHQNLAARMRIARDMCRPSEDITRAGFIRELSMKGVMAEKARQLLQDNQTSGDEYSWHPKSNILYFRLKHWPLLRKIPGALHVGYICSSLYDRVSYANPFKEYPLNKSRKIFGERYYVMRDYECGPVEGVLLDELSAMRDIDDFDAFVSRMKTQHSLTEKDLMGLLNIRNGEFIKKGLQEYF